MPRPVLVVLAGVNGAGKSAIGGHQLKAKGTTWFNPDTFARELIAATACDQDTATAHAWAEGVRLIDQAIARKQSHAFETTLGGTTIADRIRAAAATHDVIVWFCGLSSPDLHVARVRARVAAGGHDIPEAIIRERYPKAILSLIGLMPVLAELRVYDNSVSVAPGEPVPDPILVLEMVRGRLAWPPARDANALAATPDWAKPIVEAALAGRRRT
jgi:predicted ABC-type ATPase